MPKQIHKIDQFHGGLNSNSDPRDIAENELSESVDVMVDALGKIRTLGQFEFHDADAGSPTVSTSFDGEGLYSFSHSRDSAEEGNASSGSLTNTNYLLLADRDSSAEIHIYSDTGGAWSSGAVIDMGTDAMSPVFFSADGAIRVSDGNFNSNTSKFYGYIDEKDYGEPVMAAAGDTVGGEWSLQNQSISEGFSRLGNGNLLMGNGDNTTMGLNHDAWGVSREWGCTLCFVESGNGENSGTWQPNVGVRYRFYATMVYDGPEDIRKQESLPQLFRMYAGATNGWDTGNSAVGYSEDLTFVDRSTSEYFSGAAIVGDEVKLWMPNHLLNTNDHIQVAACATTAFNGVYKITNTSLNYIHMAYDGAVPAGTGYVAKVAGAGSSTGISVWFRPVVRIVGDGDNYNFDSSAMDSSSGGNPRCIGVRIYYSTNEDGHGELYLLSDIDLIKGVRLVGSRSSGISNTFAEFIDTWTDHLTFNGDLINNANEWSDPPVIETYANINGYSSDEIIDAEYKTACIMNGRVYIGNVRQGDVVSRSKMFYSPVMKYDVFPESHELTVVEDDGDEIICLKGYADRLLQFKRNKLHIINMVQDIEFLEGTYAHHGVKHQAAVCETNMGIAWVNKYGCYLYDGEKITNLLKKKGVQIIKDASTGDNDSWEEFADEYPMIGYIPLKNQLLVVHSARTSNSGAAYLYDMVTQSWVKSGSNLLPSTSKSNFVVDINGDLVYAAGDVIKKWDDTSADSTAFELKTKDIDFGQPAQRKKVYKVYVTYTGGNTPGPPLIDVTYQTDGNGEWLQFDGNLTDTTGNQVEAELKPTASINNAKSIQLKFSGNAATTFEINDISIIYRLKSVK